MVSAQPNSVKTPTPIDFVAFPKEHVNQSISRRFEIQVEKNPGRLAIKSPAGPVAYGDLNRLANRIAHAILGSHSDASQPVALVSGLDILTIAAILAILKAGRIFVPLDLTRPQSLTRQILVDAEVSMILSLRDNVKKAKEVTPPGVAILSLDELPAGLSQENPDLSIPPGALAWILYTSGTTGAPKGVMQSHRDELHNIMTVTNSHCFSPSDRMTLLRNPSVGGAIRNLFSALLNGTALFPYDINISGLASLAEWLIREEITVYHSSASIFRNFVSHLSGSTQFPKLRLIRLGSESVMWSDVELFVRHFSPACTLCNALSSTEARTYLQYFVDPRVEIGLGLLPVGYPVDDTEVVILGDDDRPVAAGDIGEMVLRSSYIFPGYWKRGDESRDDIVAEPDCVGGRLLRTGDLGRRLLDGSIEHYGRKDLTCKIRGHRVQIDAIETCLRCIPGVIGTAVVAQPWRGENRLVAYVATQREQRYTAIEFRDYLRERLPEFMIPSIFICLDELPLTPAGKIDRRALPIPNNQRPERARLLVAPKDAVERVLLEIWIQGLEIEEVGVDDNFFELGGHSLLAGEIIAKINRIFAVTLSPQALMEAGTVAKLAGLLTAQIPHPSDAERIAQLWLEIDHMDPSGVREVV